MSLLTPRVLAVTNMFPTEADPVFGAFVADQMASIASAGARVEVEFINGRRSDWEYLRGLGRVRRLARSGGFDLVHAHYGLTGFIALFQPLPLVVSFCGDDLNGTADGRGGITIKSRIIRRLSRSVAPRADAIICKSERLREMLPRAADRSRAHVIPNGVDVSRFSPGDRQVARQRLGVPGDSKLVLFPHSLRQHAVKRFDLAEAAVRILERRVKGARLWVVNGVSPAAMADYYRAADCLLLTSETEGSPNVVKEALCCDLPVVSVDVGDVAHWIRLTPGSYLVRREPEAIAETLEHVLAGPCRVDGAGVRAEIASNGVARRILGIYTEVLARRTGGAGR